MKITKKRNHDGKKWRRNGNYKKKERSENYKNKREMITVKRQKTISKSDKWQLQKREKLN